MYIPLSLASRERDARKGLIFINKCLSQWVYGTSEGVLVMVYVQKLRI